MSIEMSGDLDFATVESLGTRLRVMAAFADGTMQLAMDPDYARQLAARLDRVAVLEGQVAQGAADLAQAAKANALLERQFAQRDDAMIELQNRYVALVVWAFGLAVIAGVAFMIVLL